MQHDIASRREICCLSVWDKLRLAAERIDPSEYREVPPKAGSSRSTSRPGR